MSSNYPSYEPQYGPQSLTQPYLPPPSQPQYEQQYEPQPQPRSRSRLNPYNWSMPSMPSRSLIPSIPAWMSTKKNGNVILVFFMIIMLLIAMTGSLLNLVYNKYPDKLGINEETTDAIKNSWLLGTTISVCIAVGMNAFLSAMLIRSSRSVNQPNE